MAFANVSPEAQDLIASLLARNPGERLAGPALVRHPWVRDRLVAPGVRGATVWLAEGLPGLQPPVPRTAAQRRSAAASGAADGAGRQSTGRLSTGTQGRQSEAIKMVAARRSQVEARKSKASAAQEKLEAAVRISRTSLH